MGPDRDTRGLHNGDKCPLRDACRVKPIPRLSPTHRPSPSPCSVVFLEKGPRPACALSFHRESETETDWGRHMVERKTARPSLSGRARDTPGAARSGPEATVSLPDLSEPTRSARAPTVWTWVASRLPSSPGLPTGIGLDNVRRCRPNPGRQMATKNGEELGEACRVLNSNQPDCPESSELSVPTCEVGESSHGPGGKARDKDQRPGGCRERVPGTDLSEGGCERRRGLLRF